MIASTFDYFYSGKGLDEAAIVVQSAIDPLNTDPKPDHAVQVGIRMLIDLMRAYEQSIT